MYYQPTLQFKTDELLVYLRKSRSDDPLMSVEEVLSKHERILNEWTERNLDGFVPEENRYREVVSGETVEDRPEIQKLLKRIESPKYKAILTVEVQRLSRGDLEDAGRLIKLLRYTNTFVITPTKTYDLKDEYDRDLFERELKRGNEFLEYQKKIMARGRLLSVSLGNYLASFPPYGYDKTWVMDRKRKCPTLKINEEQAAVVRMIYDLYVNQDMGPNNICHYLDEMHITPPGGGKHWSAATIKDMLPDEHYIGKVRWNWRKTVTIVEDGEIKKTRPKAKIGDYLIYDGKHEGIIDEKLFIAAREKQGRNHRAKPNTKIRNPLASLLFCSCGRAMSLRTYKNKDGTERAPARLICDGQVFCHTGSVLFDEMIARICDILNQNIADFEICLRNNTGESVKLHGQLIKNLEKKLRDIQAKELAQWEAQADPNPANRMPQEIFKQLNEKLLKEKDEILLALHNAQKTMPEAVEYKDKIVRFQAALDALCNPMVDAQTKNRLLKNCIERIEYFRATPERLKRKSDEPKGSRLKVGGAWTQPPIKLNIKLKV